MPRQILSAARRLLESNEISVQAIANTVKIPELTVEKVLRGEAPVSPTDNLTREIMRRVIELALTCGDRGQRERMLTIAGKLHPEGFAARYEAVERCFALHEVALVHKRRLRRADVAKCDA